MRVKSTTIDFTGQRINVGLDVHKESWKSTICTEHVIHKSFIVVKPLVDNLVNYLECNYPNGDYYCAYEAGFSGFWAQEELTKRGVKTIVVNPADIPTSDKERQFKNDKRDLPSRQGW